MLRAILQWKSKDYMTETDQPNSELLRDPDPALAEGQLSLFDGSAHDLLPPRPQAQRKSKRPPDPGWPSPLRFPFNDPASKQTVAAVVLHELRTSRQPLIITGFTSLPQIVTLFAHYATVPHAVHVRLLIGYEPNLTYHAPTYRAPSATTFSREVEDYWLDRGISVHLSAEVLAAITFLERDDVEIRISGHPQHPVHAKIYRADYAITIGSSNLSTNGMRTQFEANRRHEVTEPAAFREASTLAEQLWKQGRDYKAKLITLLKHLLRAVTWQEALARACAEILDGQWARRYTLSDPLDEGPRLWPAQRQGVAQAMWLVDQVGSVLVASTPTRSPQKNIRFLPMNLSNSWLKIGSGCNRLMSALSPQSSEWLNRTRRKNDLWRTINRTLWVDSVALHCALQCDHRNAV